jgi:hypothetical protein
MEQMKMLGSNSLADLAHRLRQEHAATAIALKDMGAKGE